ncbi:MAG: TonB-dependent receptor plug domain-containing protein [Ferrimonas sp.]
MSMESSVSKAVRRALMYSSLSAVALAGISAPASANEVDSTVERIEVTGSRIKQVDIETSSPVTVINAADIKITGEMTVADVLNNASINSFGSWRGTSGYGAGASSTSDVNLRGVGSQATLVLLDGRRMPGTSSSSGTVADTSSIPMAIVERIEILRDGASAVYGSDAVAGVINIITKKDFEGVEVNYTGEVPDVTGGETNRVSISAGFINEKGSLTITFEHYDAASVYDRDIWNMDDPSYFGYSSFSSVPNGLYATSDGSYEYYSSSAMCAESPNVVDGTDNNAGRCFFDYGAVTKLYGNTNKNSILSNFTYKLNEAVQLRGRFTAAMSETETRYAATPVSTSYPVMSADNIYNPVGSDMTLLMRSDQLGNRDSVDETNSVDALIGLVGFVDFAHGIDWEVNFQHSRATTNSYSYNLINDSIVQGLIDSEQYDLFNISGMSYADWNAMMTEFYGQAAHTGIYQGRFTSTQIDGLASTYCLKMIRSLWLQLWVRNMR